MLNDLTASQLVVLGTLQNSIANFVEAGRPDGRMAQIEGGIFDTLLPKWGFVIQTGNGEANLHLDGFLKAKVSGSPEVCGAAISLALKEILDPTLFSRLFSSQEDLDFKAAEAFWMARKVRRRDPRRRSKNEEVSRRYRETTEQLSTLESLLTLPGAHSAAHTCSLLKGFLRNHTSSRSVSLVRYKNTSQRIGYRVGPRTLPNLAPAQATRNVR